MKSIHQTVLCALCVLCGEVASALDATLAPRGVVRIAAGGHDYTLEPLAAFPGWAWAQRSGGYEVSPEGAVALHLTDGSRPGLALAVTLHPLDGGRVELGYAFTALENLSTLSLGCCLKLPADAAFGHAWRIGETAGVFLPPADGGLHLATGSAASFAFALGASGETLQMEVGGPLSPAAAGSAAERGETSAPPAVDCLIQDNSRWTPEYHIRLGALGERGLAKGETVSFSFMISLASGEPLAVKTASPCVIKPGGVWVPLDYRRDIVAGSALDFTGFRPSDAPAGRHGWLRNVGGHFEFEGLPGKPQRFCGVNLCFTANYPDHATADALATRLRRLGYNAVRIHHHDGIWKNAFDSRHAGVEGVGDAASGSVNAGNDGPESASCPPAGPGGGVTVADDDIDRLDYLLARCYENGLYATTDLYVSRPVAWRDIGVDQDGEVDIHVFKMLCALYEPAFENWAKFAEDFLLHENPYTGRRYIDEPAMPFLSLINEGGFFVGWNSGGRDDPRVAAAWREWMTARRAADPGFAPDCTPDQTPRTCWEGNVHPAIAQWTGELEARMVARMKAHLRSLGCRALVSNDNCGPHYAALQRATTDLDYIDDHFYIDHPSFPETLWNLPSTCQNANPLRDGEHLQPSQRAFTRMFGKPFTLSEWNFTGPGRYRGMGGILAGAMAALQDWDGLWRFDYSHTRDNIGDRDIREGSFFDLAADPLAQAADRACLCLFLRGDLAPLTDGVALWDTPESATLPGKTLWGYPPWCDAAWAMRVGSCLDPADAGGLRVLRREEAESGVAPGAPAPCLSLDRERGTLAVVTPRTCGGFAPSGRLDAGPLSFEIVESPIAPTTLWVSSLDGSPIKRSSRLLLTHLTDVQGKGARYADDSRTILLKWGKAPLIEVGEAEVTLRFDAGDAGTASPDGGCRIFALDTAGHRVAEVPFSFSDGALHFRIHTDGPEGGRIHYEIVRNSP